MITFQKDNEIGCYVSGGCYEGTAIGFQVVGSTTECLNACKDFENCNYFTMDLETNLCTQ